MDKARSYTSPWPTYSPSELNVALHDRDALCVDRTKVPEQTPLDLLGLTPFCGSELTRLRIDEQGRLPPLLEERGWPNSATVVQLLHSRSIVSSCPVRLLEPTKQSRTPIQDHCCEGGVRG